jgi:hypothetical protein
MQARLNGADALSEKEVLGTNAIAMAKLRRPSLTQATGSLFLVESITRDTCFTLQLPPNWLRCYTSRV